MNIIYCKCSTYELGFIEFLDMPILVPEDFYPSFKEMILSDKTKAVASKAFEVLKEMYKIFFGLPVPCDAADDYAKRAQEVLLEWEEKRLTIPQALNQLHSIKRAYHTAIAYGLI